MKSWFTEKKKDSPTLRHSRTFRPKISRPIPIEHDWQSNTPTEENNYPTAFNDSNRLDYKDSVESPLSLTPQQNVWPDLQPDFAKVDESKPWDADPSISSVVSYETRSQEPAVVPKLDSTSQLARTNLRRSEHPNELPAFDDSSDSDWGSAFPYRVKHHGLSTTSNRQQSIGGSDSLPRRKSLQRTISDDREPPSTEELSERLDLLRGRDKEPTTPSCNDELDNSISGSMSLKLETIAVDGRQKVTLRRLSTNERLELLRSSGKKPTAPSSNELDNPISDSMSLKLETKAVDGRQKVTLRRLSTNERLELLRGRDKEPTSPSSNDESDKSITGSMSLNLESVEDRQEVTLRRKSPNIVIEVKDKEEANLAFESFHPPQRAPRLGGQLHLQKGSTAWTDKMRRDTRAYPPLRYQPLSESSFRVLILHPGEEGSKIKCRLKEVDLSTPPRYEALSYVWGHEPPIHQIEVDNHPVHIRPNLFYALQRVRDRAQSVLLWVDSLCINQLDESERNAQVRRMASIFQNAQNVCIWLGEEDSTSRIAMEFIPQVGGPQFLRDKFWWKQYGVTAFNKLLERPWFRRGWIIQEAAFSSNAILFCGEHQVHMADFSDAVSIIRARLSSIIPSTHQHGKKMPFVDAVGNFRDSPAMRLLDTIKGVFLKSHDGVILGRKLSLETLVELATFCETTDPRDAIYALLNLANDADASSKTDFEDAIIPDYGSPLLTVFIDFMCHCFSKSKSLDMICRPWAPVSISNDYEQAEGRNSDPSLIRHLPSWIASRDALPFGNPSWRVTQMHGKPFVGTSRKRLYNAHYNTVPEVIVSRAGVLRAKGLLLCEITQRSTRMADAIVLKECLDILGVISRDQQSNLIDLPELIWRTLCADRDAKGEPAPSIYRMAMFHLLQLHSELPETNYGQDSTENRRVISSIDVEGLLNTDLPEDVVEFLQVVRDVVWNRRTFRSETSGKTVVGLIPQHARIGDRICILRGCSVPVVLRQHGTPESPRGLYWQLIGEAYVHGVMDGEAMCSYSADLEDDFEIR